MGAWKPRGETLDTHTTNGLGPKNGLDTHTATKTITYVESQKGPTAHRLLRPAGELLEATTDQTTREQTRYARTG